MAGLTQKQMQQYQSDGFTILKGVFSKKECEDFIEHMMDLHSGRKCLEGFKPHGPDGLGRTHNQHLYDPRELNFLIDADSYLMRFKFIFRKKLNIISRN